MNVSEIQDKKRILFVDDEPNVLAGFRRSLHPMRDEWDVFFAAGGAEALDLLASQPVDLVVSDLRMPDMDGVDLLNAVRIRHPRAIRLVLSGYADRFMILRCAGPSHQFLAKPCDSDQLIKAIRRAFALRDILQRHELQRFLQDDVVLPALPGLYQALMRALQSRDSGMAEIADLISRDADMAAKLLHLVNSAFVVYIESIQQAVSYLGAEAMSAIALTAALFEPYLAREDPAFGIQAHYDHSVSVGATAGRWVSKTFKDRKRAEEATMAGMTHDIGKLVMIHNRPDEWRQTLALSNSRRISLHAAEQEVFGITHADVGAYLLNQWGVADNVVEAVAYHHHPSACHGREQNSLFAVHAANALCHKHSEPGLRWRQLLDHPYLAAVDPQWDIDLFQAAAEQT